MAGRNISQYQNLEKLAGGVDFIAMEHVEGSRLKLEPPPISLAAVAVRLALQRRESPEDPSGIDGSQEGKEKILV